MNCERCGQPMRRTRIPIRICARCKRTLAPSPTLAMWKAAKMESTENIFFGVLTPDSTNNTELV